MRAKSKILLSSALAIIVCISMIVGATLAIFTVKDKTNVTITTAKVDVTGDMSVAGVKENGETDYRVAEAEDNVYYIDKEDGRSVEVLESGDIALQNIAYGDYVKLSFGVRDNGSTIDVVYRVGVLVESETELSKALDIVLTDSEGVDVTGKDGEYLAVTEYKSIASGGTEEYSVEIGLPTDVEIALAGEQCNVSIVVEAMQKNALKEAAFDSSMADEYIDENGVLNIPEVVNGAIITSIERGHGEGAFEGNTDIKEVILPSTLKQLASYVFEDCINLKKVTLSEGLEEISYASFRGCTNLSEINIPSTVTRIQTDAFRNCTSLTNLVLPDMLEMISSGAFWGCKNITEINIPSTVTHIGGNAFYDCASLTSVVLPDSIDRIEDDTFESCTNLTSVVFPKGLTAIGERAFQSTGLAEVTIPETVTSVEANAFGRCNNMTKLVVLGDIGDSNDSSTCIVSSCYNLQSIRFSKKSKNLIGYNVQIAPLKLDKLNIYYDGSLSEWMGHKNHIIMSDIQKVNLYLDGETEETGGTPVGGEVVISGVDTIPSHCLTNCGVTKVIISEGVTAIANNAFSSDNYLKSVVISASVTEIGDRCFVNSEQLESVMFEAAGNWKLLTYSKEINLTVEANTNYNDYFQENYNYSWEKVA